MRATKLAVILPVLGLASLSLLGAYAASPTDWPEYGNDPGGMRYSPLTQITPANVGKLKVAWTYGMNPQPVPGQPRGMVAGSTAGGRGRVPTSTATPIMVGGVMYLPTPFGRVVALNADSGKQIWAYALPGGDQPPFRGVSYWPGDARHAPRIIFGTIGGKLVALDAKTGEPSKGFGENGMVDLKTNAIMNGFDKAGYGITAPGSIYKNLIILGSRVQERPQLGPSGAVRAFDIITGKQAWSFSGIAQPGDQNHATWEDEGWKQRSGVNVWNLMTVDAQRGIAYLPFGAPTIDRYGGDHKGMNLYSSSLVAVNAATGKYLWHFQLTHHDIWDLDYHTPPTLITVRRNSRNIPAVAAINKGSFLFILDRVTDNAPPGKQDTGRVSNGGPILTASGLTFIAGTDDARFRAFDTRTGKELWTYKLDYSGHATPITYRGKNGKQYVVVIATGGSYLGSPAGGDSVMAFTLP